MSALQRMLFIAILLMGAVARFAALDSIPRGVHPDEAIDGNDGIYAVEHSQPQLFYQGNNGREGLFINAIGASVWLFGSNQFGLRFPSALTGTAAIVLIFLFAQQLFGTPTALWAAFFLATSFWHLNFSRIAFRAILVPTLLLAAFYCLRRAWCTEAFVGGRAPSPQPAPSWLATPQMTTRAAWQPFTWAIAGGLAFGLGFHSYIAFRIAPVIAIVMLWGGAAYARASQTNLRRWRQLTATWLIAAFAAALPMGIYFLRHPEDFSARTNQLSVFSHPNAVATVLVASAKSALMFNWKGDCNDWHNLACEPQLPIPIGLLFALGVAIAMWGLFRPALKFEYALLLTWLVVMLMPSIAAWEGTPHALRSIGAIPAVFMLTAIAADAVYRRISFSRILQVAFLAVILGTGLFEYYRYFAIWPNRPGTLERSRHYLTSIAEYLNSLPPGTPRFVIENDYGPLDPADPGIPDKKVYLPAQTVIFLTHGHPKPEYVLVDDAFRTPFPPGSVIIPLINDARIFDGLRTAGIKLQEEPHQEFVAARIP